MLKWFKTKDRIFWISAFLLTVFISGPATAAGTDSTYQNSGTITVSGPEGTHVAPNMFPLLAGDTLTEGLSAGSSDSGTNPAGQECVIDSTTFSYTNVVMTYSPDGIQPFTSGVGSASIGGLTPATGAATLTASFPSGGYYVITYNLHMDYTSSTCGNNSANSPGSLSFAVAAGDFAFTLNPGSLNINQGESAPTDAPITSIKGFSSRVSFSTISADAPGFAASGSGIPPPNGTTQNPNQFPMTQYPDATIYVAVGKTVPLGSHKMSIRGSASIGGINLAHDQPFSVNVTQRGLTITRPGAHDEKVSANGNKSGDTVYSYNSYTPKYSVATPNLNTQTFTIGFLGTWSIATSGTNNPVSQPNVNFTWTPNESDDTYNTGIWQVPFGTVGYYVPPPVNNSVIGQIDSPTSSHSP